MNDQDFIEKLHQFIPNKIDWVLETEALGRNLVGYRALGDLWTSEITQTTWKEFV